MNYYAAVKNFLENRRDTSNNRFKTYKPVAERLAKLSPLHEAGK